MNIFRHRHELEHGHTSSMSRQIIGFADDGRIVNHDSFLTEWADIVKESSKLIMFIDLAGNKRYFKTTLFGLTSQVPDYALVAIGADQGISETTKEHLRIIVALNIPCFVTLTRSDLASPEQLQSTLELVNFTFLAAFFNFVSFLKFWVNWKLPENLYSLLIKKTFLKIQSGCFTNQKFLFF